MSREIRFSSRVSTRATLRIDENEKISKDLCLPVPLSVWNQKSLLFLYFLVETTCFEAVFDLGADKVLGVDGFSIFFYQKFWLTVSDNVIKLCEDFYSGKANVERINWASIALILKVEDSVNLSHFRPIVLINSMLKIIFKIMASQLNKVIGSLVNIIQSSF